MGADGMMFSSRATLTLTYCKACIIKIECIYIEVALSVVHCLKPIWRFCSIGHEVDNVFMAEVWPDRL